MSGSSDRDASCIEILGARANNLKNLDVQIPLHAATLIVGVSGSGKSSLLIETLGAEGNRRMDRFLGISNTALERYQPEAYIGPMPPVLHFGQGAFRASRRTTVATCSGMLNVLRKLFLQHSAPWSRSAEEPVPSPSASSFAAWLGRHYSGPLDVWAVPLRHSRSDGQKAKRALEAIGIQEAVLRSETDPPSLQESGRAVLLSELGPLDSSFRHTLEAKVAQIQKPEQKTELISALESAFKAGGAVVVELHTPGPEIEEIRGPFGVLLDSDRHWVHPAELLPFAPPSHSLLSFNQPSQELSGACPTCSGLGLMPEVVVERLIPHPEKSMHGGAVDLWTSKNYKYINIQHETIEGLREMRGFDPDKPWRELSREAQALILDGGVDVVDRDLESGRSLGAARPFEGLGPAVLSRFLKNTATSARLAPYVRDGACKRCGGSRWSRNARALRVAEKDLSEILGLPFATLVEETERDSKWAKNLEGARAVVSELNHLARSFVNVGLGHLSGDRGMLTLSEGESRRLRLAGLLATPGAGLALLLDEPARGLHEHDINGLALAMNRLKERHTLIVNDHRFGLGAAMDHVLELGPGAGSRGGELVRQGPPGTILETETAPPRAPVPTTEKHPALVLRKGTLHNLREITCRIPLGRWVTITGVSGSGKSSFVRGLLMPALSAALGESVSLQGFHTLPGGHWESFDGAERLSEVLAVEQKPSEPNKRSTVATFLNVADKLRKAFAAVPEAKKLGLKARDFGLNSGEGRCPTCLGLGEVDESLCPSCAGRRYGDLAQSVRLDGRSIVDVLEASLSELEGISADAVGLGSLLRLLIDLDLGYLSLGRRLDLLSGGEVQRLRIAERLWRADGQRLLLVLDEPSAGLHPKDVRRLAKVFRRLVDEEENTVLLIEHNLDLIRSSDWLIDFGPGGGPSGGRIVAQGPPALLEGIDIPTGRALKGERPSLENRWTEAVAADRARREPTLEQAREAQRKLKLLLGYDSAIPQSDDADLSMLAVIPDLTALSRERPHEIGGLDRDLALLFLERPADETTEEKILREWELHPEGALWIAPALGLIQTWGPQVPQSQVEALRKRIKALGLKDTRSASHGAGEWRASGPRFHPSSGPEERSRSACLREALAIGGGMVELVQDGRLLARLKTRYLDLEALRVAPARISPNHLLRQRPEGRCPACLGEGRVRHLDLDLIVQDPSRTPATDEFYRPEALSTLRGIRRAVLMPFLRRMAQEGLWPGDASLKQLGDNERNWLLFGFWRRPGPGSFLKSPKADAAKVASWLRWDGLYAHAWEELPRSKSKAWAKEVRRTAQRCKCRVCEGSGLAESARLVSRYGRSLHEWVTSGTVGELAEAMVEERAADSRQDEMQQRLVRVLEKLPETTPLDRPVHLPGEALEAAGEAVKSLTSLQLLGSL